MSEIYKIINKCIIKSFNSLPILWFTIGLKQLILNVLKHSLLHCQAGSGAYSASCPMRTGGYFPGTNVAIPWN
jgi:hypothetical protein